MAEHKTMEKSAKRMPAVGNSSEINSVSGDATENKSVVGGNTQSKSAVGDDTDSMSAEVKDTDRKYLVGKDRETNSLVEGTEKKSLGKGTVVEKPVVKVATQESEETAATNMVVEESTKETVVEATTKAVVEKGVKETVVETGAEKTIVEEPRAEEPRAEETRAEETRAEEPRAEEPRAEEPRAEEPRAEGIGVKEMGLQETFVEKGAAKIRAEETPAEETPAEETRAEEPRAEEPRAEEPRAEEPRAEEPRAEEPRAEEPRAEEPRAEGIGVKEMGLQETFVEKGAAKIRAEETPAEEPRAEEPRAEEPRAEEPRAEEPRAEEIEVEETGAAEETKTAVEGAGKKTAAQNRPVNSNGLLVTVGIIGILLALLVFNLFQPQPPLKQQEEPLVIFRREVQRIQSQFPSQRPELWRRSRIHLERHLQTAHPTEPVSLILTAGTKAEKTLHCLAQRLACAFSSALNASVLNINGASKASQDSNQVKLEIDGQLQRAFEGDQPVAVIHRFEELPPGSTLIFYRYCDHENAAYKNVSLFFTVLLGGEELQADLSLSVVEEMVDDHLKSKFLSSDQPTSFDTMDVDKFSGLWSRISHLILPVAVEKTMELEGCGETGRTQSPS